MSFYDDDPTYRQPRKHEYIDRTGRVARAHLGGRGTLKGEAFVPFTAEDSGPEAGSHDTAQGTRPSSVHTSAHMRAALT